MNQISHTDINKHALLSHGHVSTINFEKEFINSVDNIGPSPYKDTYLNETFLNYETFTKLTKRYTTLTMNRHVKLSETKIKFTFIDESECNSLNKQIKDLLKSQHKLLASLRAHTVDTNDTTTANKDTTDTRSLRSIRSTASSQSRKSKRTLNLFARFKSAF